LFAEVPSLNFVSQSATRTLGISKIAEFVVLKRAFIKFFYVQSVNKRFGIYQLAEILLLKSAFFKLLMFSLQLNTWNLSTEFC